MLEKLGTQVTIECISPKTSPTNHKISASLKGGTIKINKFLNKPFVIFLEF